MPTIRFEYKQNRFWMIVDKFLRIQIGWEWKQQQQQNEKKNNFHLIFSKRDTF